MVQSQWFDIRKFISIAVLHTLFPPRSRIKKQLPLILPFSPQREKSKSTLSQWCLRTLLESSPLNTQSQSLSHAWRQQDRDGESCKRGKRQNIFEPVRDHHTQIEHLVSRVISSGFPSYDKGKNSSSEFRSPYIEKNSPLSGCRNTNTFFQEWVRPSWLVVMPFTVIFRALLWR